MKRGKKEVKEVKRGENDTKYDKIYHGRYIRYDHKKY